MNKKFAILFPGSGVQVKGMGRDIYNKFSTAKDIYDRSIIELPDDMFQNKFNQKSILVFQNHGENAVSSEALLTKLDSMKNKKALIKFNVKLNEWYTKNIH